MRRPLLADAFLLAAVITVTGLSPVGCGKDDKSSSTVDGFCADVAKKICAAVSPKCVQSSPAACEMVRKAECLKVASGNMTGARVFHPENTSACLDKTASVYGKPAITPADFADMDDVCARVFQGTKKMFEACTIDYDCEKKLVCDKMKCGPKVSKKKGEPCANPGEVCEAGAYCLFDATSMSWACVAKKIAGDACSATAPCLENLRCSADKCVDRVGLAQACTTNGDCLPAAPYCDPDVGNKCALGLSFSGNAPSCSKYGGGAGAGDGGGGDGGTGDAGGGDGGGDTGGGADAGGGDTGGDASSG